MTTRRWPESSSFPFPASPKYLVFHRAVEGGIEVIRVLHGDCDIDGILAVEFAAADDNEKDA
jgi:plasmid stabilization system protein ParE